MNLKIGRFIDEVTKVLLYSLTGALEGLDRLWKMEIENKKLEEADRLEELENAKIFDDKKSCSQIQRYIVKRWTGQLITHEVFAESEEGAIQQIQDDEWASVSRKVSDPEEEWEVERYNGEKEDV
jgi:hypothetical protein